MTAEQLKRQVEHLNKVKPEEWIQALDALTEEMTKSELLGGAVVGGAHKTKRIVGGKTKYGAHSEAVLMCNALYYYQSDAVKCLYNGTWTWKEGVSLTDQLKLIVKSRIPKAADKFKRKKEKEARQGINTTPVSLDERWMGGHEDDLDEETEYQLPDDDGQELGLHSETGVDNSVFPDEFDNFTESSDHEDVEQAKESDAATEEEHAIIVSMVEKGLSEKHIHWEQICQVAEVDERLKAFVQVTGECKTLSEVRKRLGLKAGEAKAMTDKIKEMIRKNNKNGTKKNDQVIEC